MRWILLGYNFPGQQYVHSYTFDVQPIIVKVDVSKITETLPYNPNSEPCRKYLGDRGEFATRSLVAC